MFERRVEKSASWVTENEDSFQNFTSVEEDFHERTISNGGPLFALYSPSLMLSLPLSLPRSAQSTTVTRSPARGGKLIFDLDNY